MSAKDLVARIGQVATKGKHKDRFLYVGTIEPKDALEKFFYLIEIDSPWVDGEKIKNAIINTIGENYQPGADKDKNNAFEEIIKKINLQLGDLSQAGEHEWIGKLNAIVGLSSGEELIFSQTGNISGYLFRGNKISHITEKPVETEEIHPLKTFVSVINGSIADNDKVVIGNNQLYSHLSLDRLRQIFSAFKYKDAIAEIVRVLRRVKIKDVNLIVFDFLSVDEASAEIDEKPEITLLDDIPDSHFVHYSKLFFRGVGRGAKATGRGVKKAGQFWAKSIQPKISSGAKNLSHRTKNISRGAFVTASKKISAGPKINYFGRTVSRHESTAGTFWQNLVAWYKKLLQPENRKYLYIGLIVIFLAIGLIKITINNQKNTNLKSQGDALAALDSARSTYAKALDDLGNKKTGAKDELIQAREFARKATSDKAIHDEAINLLNQIQVKLDELNNATRISADKEPDFSLAGNNLKIIAVGASIYSFDADGKINNFDTRNKNITPVVSLGSSDGKVKDLTFSDNYNSIYIYTDASKVKQLNLSTNALTDALVTDTSGKWENSVAISLFSTNLYLLDADAGQIWKHTASDSGYSKGSAYIPKPTVSIKGAVDLAIDGDVYILQADGSTVRVKKSVVDSAFNLNAPPTPDNKIAGPEKIYAGTDSSLIYILDKTANRVLQFSKTGAYQKQFVLDSSLPLTDFALNGKLKKLWLLSENKIFEINL